MTNKFRIFEGNNARSPGNLERMPDKPPPWRDLAGLNRPEIRGKNYKASEKEIELVNAALLLKRPLLVEGFPGVGKSSLAYAVAFELDLGDVHVWPITSRSTLQDGLYRYDAIARLQEVTLQKKQEDEQGDQKALSESLDDMVRFIRLGPIGAAFARSESKKPAVVLIDEIDKSDVDLPNDLLHLFEEGEFEIMEIARHPDSRDDTNQPARIAGARSTDIFDVNRNGVVKCSAFPLIIMTSNGEREFPPAFRRRCIPLTIKEPDAAKLRDIIEQHLDLHVEEGDDKSDAAKLIKAFLKERDENHRTLATDQLLNALYLLNEGLPVLDRDHLRQALFAALSES